MNMLDGGDALRRIAHFLARHQISQEKFIELAGLSCSISTLNRWLNDPVEWGPKIGGADLRKLNKFIEQEGIRSDSTVAVHSLGGFPDYMYFSMLRYLEHNALSEEETKATAVGLYRLYRPSLKIPNMFTIGIFNITVSSEGALCVREVRHFRPGPEDKERQIREEFHGYMIRKRRRYICFQRNVVRQNPNFLFTVFNDEFIDGGDEARIFSLGGVAFGTSGSRMYLSRVFIERCSEGENIEKLESEINYVTEKDLKPSVYRYLRLEPGKFYDVF